ncbi:MAG: clostripain-related cysteine peptidase [Candidatus Cloacimonetes bacterium]|nr:clostripain-related cysteine peptidase [Candidatus Cloacimonadota bacterium]
MKKIFVLLLFVLTISVIHAKDWLFFVYMAADNGLYQYALDDINKLEKGIQSNMEIIVFIDHLTGSEKEGAEVIKIVKDSTDNIVSPRVKYYGNVNSGDYHTLNDFMKWGQSHYSGKNEIMIIWSHGTGWFRGETKHICPDNSYSSAISVARGELRKAFQGLRRKFDLLLFDACLMGNLETLVEVKEFCNYSMASINEMPAIGLPWTDILNQWNLFDNKEDRYNSIIDKYLESHDYGGSQNPYGDYYNSIALFLADMRNLESLLHDLKSFADYYALRASDEVFANAREQCITFNDMQADIEVKQYFQLLKESAIEGDTLWVFADRIINSLDRVFVKVNSLNLAIEGYASIWYPIYEDVFYELYVNLYHNLEINKTRFCRFINYSFGKDTIAPLAPRIIKKAQTFNSLHLEWAIPIDPCNLSYQIEVFVDGVFKEFANVTETVFSFTFDHFVSHGKIVVRAVDEVGNISEPVFAEYNKQTNNKFSAYVSPNPIKYDYDAEIHWVSDKELANLDIFLYNISGDLLAKKTLNNIYAGEHYITLKQLLNNNKKISTGLYTLILKTGEFSTIIKVAIIR